MSISTPNTTWTVLSTSPSFGTRGNEPLDLLRAAGCEVDVVPGLTDQQLREALADADAWIVGFEAVGAATLADAPRVRVVAKNGAGTDNFDHEWLAARSVAVRNVPGGNADAVAEYAIGQLLALARGIAANDRSVREGRWGPVVGTGLRGRKLGVLGLGRVGRRVAALATAFDMHVHAHDPGLDATAVREAGAIPNDADELFAEMDAITVHVPLTDGTRGLVDARRLRLLGPEGYLVDCSRGGVVDEQSLVSALRSGGLAGAALDVFTQEPLPPDSPLRYAPRLLLSPHTAGYSDTALAAVSLQCARNVLEELRRTDGVTA